MTAPQDDEVTQDRGGDRLLDVVVVGGIDWDQVDRDIYEPMLGPMVQQQLADRPELLARLSG